MKSLIQKGMKPRGSFNLPKGGDITSLSGDLARAKMALVNDESGFPSVKSQQGSGLLLFHTKALVTNAAISTIEFFKNLSTQDPIISNVDAQNGLVGDKESVALAYVQFHILVYDPATSLVTVYDLPVFGAGAANLQAGFYAGSFSIKINNEDKLKATPTSVFHPSNSTLQQGAANPGTYNLMNPIIVPSLGRVTVQLILPAFTAVANEHLRCTIGGPAAIQASKFNY